MGADEATMAGVEGAAEFGAAPLLSTLLSLAAYDYPEAIQHRLLESAIQSDCALTCAAVLGLVTRPLPEAISSCSCSCSSSAKIAAERPGLLLHF